MTLRCKRATLDLRFNAGICGTYCKGEEMYYSSAYQSMYYSTTYHSPVGIITLACYKENLVGLWIEGQKYHGDTIPEAMVENNDMPVFDTAKKWR